MESVTIINRKIEIINLEKEQNKYRIYDPFTKTDLAT